MTSLTPSRFWTRGRSLGAALALAIVGVFVAANAHLFAVAFANQPECVPHLKSAKEGAATFRAAKSSC